MLDLNNIPAVKIKNLHFSYGNIEILKGINLDFKRGNFFSIIGPNGSGKTTLIKNTAGFFGNKKNTIYINGIDICKKTRNDLAKEIAVVPQKTETDFEFTVMDMVMMGRSPYLKRFRTESIHDIQIVDEVMHDMNIFQLRDRDINQISGGEYQRCIIARALAQKTNILLLDEPISQLDIHHQVDLLTILKKLVKENKMTIISILHDLNLASTYSDEIVLMDNGKIIIKGAPKDVFTKNNIKNVYKIDVKIINNPVNEKPMIIPKIM